MSDEVPPNILAELDARQDEVIEQLEELNARVLNLLETWTSKRDHENSEVAAPDALEPAA